MALLLLLGGVAGALPGCGGANATPAELRLQREDLIAVSKALKRAELPIAREVAAAKQAWPLVANGLPPGPLQSVRAPVAVAAESAAKIRTPALLEEAEADSLTGPAAELAGLFRTYDGLATRGWRLTGAAIDQIEEASARPRPGVSGTTGSATSTSGTAATGAGGSAADMSKALAAARFARENVGLYIESVYDGHFDLAQIGKKLHDGYRKLGGPAAFGGSLTPGEVADLADAYSEATARLHPHVGVRLGS
ncbi:MAG TPA: hypothetical protein VES65_07305 [Solirubrobacteraceae bacterium]|nr:hypothetical protein [Solirubrobacteraceae bacterium]